MLGTLEDIQAGPDFSFSSSVRGPVLLYVRTRASHSHLIWYGKTLKNSNDEKHVCHQCYLFKEVRELPQMSLFLSLLWRQALIRLFEVERRERREALVEILRFPT